MDSIWSRLTRTRSFVAVTSGDVAGPVLDDEAGEGAAVGGADVAGEVLLADDGAGIDEADEQVLAVVAVGVGQVGADRAALAEEPVAGGAGCL